MLVLAGILRFTGLSWGLRHTPVRDEQDFVENVGQMLAHRNLDHRFYEYPGLFFELLCPVLAAAPSSPPYISVWDGLPRVTQYGASGYLAARGLVAAFGVFSVALVMLLGSRLVGPNGGLLAGALLAASPVEVFVSHEIRPDVVLETFVLLALLAYQRLGERDRNDILAGAATGAAAAVKFTGVLLLPSWFLARALAPGRRLRGAVLAGLAALIVWVAMTPYAVLAAQRFAAGALFQVNWHYRDKGISPAVARNAFFYARTIAWSLGPVGVVLGLVGLAAARREARTWAPVVAYPLAVVAVLSTASVHWHRLVLSALGLVALVAGRGFEVLARRAPRASWAVAAVAVLAPFVTSVDYLRSVALPGTRDLALDWIEAHVPPGARVLNTVHELGLDRSRFEVIEQTGKKPLDRRLAREVDLVVWHRWSDAPLTGLESVWRGEPRSGGGGFGQKPESASSSLDYPIVLYRVPADVGNRYRRVAVTPATASASSNGADADKATDGRLDTLWATESSREDEWFQLVWPAPERVARVELRLGNLPNRYGLNPQLAVTTDGERWTPVPSASARPPVPEQIGRDAGKASQVLVLEPTLTRGIRVSQEGGAAPRPWGFAEIEVSAIDEGMSGASGK